MCFGGGCGGGGGGVAFVCSGALCLLGDADRKIAVLRTLEVWSRCIQELGIFFFLLKYEIPSRYDIFYHGVLYLCHALLIPRFTYTLRLCFTTGYLIYTTR